LAQFPENTRVESLSVAVDYRFASRGDPGRRHLKVPAVGAAASFARDGRCRHPGLGGAAHRSFAAVTAQRSAPQFDFDRRNGGGISRGLRRLPAPMPDT